MMAAQPEVDAQGRPVPGGRLGDWHESAWRLERKFPQRYGRREAVTFDPTGGDGAGDLDTAKAARDRLASYVARVAASGGQE